MSNFSDLKQLVKFTKKLTDKICIGVGPCSSTSFYGEHVSLENYHIIALTPSGKPKNISSD